MKSAINSINSPAREKIRSAYDQILQMGKEKGIQEGMEKGIQEGMEKGIQEGMEKGIQEGMEKGIQEGMEKGIQEGMEKGIQEGIEKGIQEERLRKNFQVFRKGSQLGMSVQELVLLTEVDEETAQSWHALLSENPEAELPKA